MNTDGDGGDEDDFCYAFTSANDCVRNHLSTCFAEEDIDRTANETLGELRKAITKLILHPAYQKKIGFTLSENDLDAAFEGCPNIPEKSFAENLKLSLFFLALTQLQLIRIAPKRKPSRLT